MSKDVLLDLECVSSQRVTYRMKGLPKPRRLGKIHFHMLLLIVEKSTTVGCHVLHFDVFTAFLNGDTDNELYV